MTDNKRAADDAEREAVNRWSIEQKVFLTPDQWDALWIALSARADRPEPATGAVYVGKDSSDEVAGWMKAAEASAAEVSRLRALLLEMADGGKDSSDAARIDWLEQEDEMGFYYNIDHISANINGGFNGFKTLREAIDAAIAGEKK